MRRPQTPQYEAPGTWKACGFYHFVSNYEVPYFRTRLSRLLVMSNTNDISPSPTTEDETDSVIDDATLLEYEIWWRDRYVMLEERGYRLRPRFRPDWVPSWRTSGGRWVGSEDALLSRVCLSALIHSTSHVLITQHSKTMDATRFRTGDKVFIKRIEKGGSEKAIASYLSSEELSKDPRNHCVPIIETFDDVIETDIEFLVMPYLREWISPPFMTVEEALDFMRQTIEVRSKLIF